MQIAMQKQYGDIVELLRTSSHGPLYMRPHNSFMSEIPAYQSPHHQLVTPPTSKKKKSKSMSGSGGSHSGATASHFHGNFMSGVVSYPASSTGTTTSSSASQLHREGLAMSELHQHQHHHHTSTAQSIATASSYAHHHSPPNYPPPTPVTVTTSHSPPLPPHCQPHSYSTTGHYSVTTPPSSGYSDHTPPTYELVGDGDALPSVSMAHTGRHHSAAPVVDGYPLYPSNADMDNGTRPLQHLPVTTAGMQTNFHAHSMGTALTPDSVGNHYVPTPGVAYSPPQSGGSISQRSPQSTLQPSPNSYGASPQSLTPSPPESQYSQHPTIAALGTVHVEPGYNYPSHILHQHFVGSTPV